MFSEVRVEPPEWMENGTWKDDIRTISTRHRHVELRSKSGLRVVTMHIDDQR